MTLTRLALAASLIACGATFATVGVPASCYACMSPFRPLRPVNVTPATTNQCIRNGGAMCTTCPLSEVIRLCSTPTMPTDVPWFIRPFI